MPSWVFHTYQGRIQDLKLEVAQMCDGLYGIEGCRTRVPIIGTRDGIV